MLGDPLTGELIALKRVSKLRGFTTSQLTFEWDEDWDENMKDVVKEDGTTAPGYSFCLYLICDSYIGLDMQYSFDVAKPEERKPDMYDSDEEDEGGDDAGANDDGDEDDSDDA